jgi:hypothetical protein
MYYDEITEKKLPIMRDTTRLLSFSLISPACRGPAQFI